ncbi:hypothetical protein CR983_01450 [Candidatus Saccharibacteria bacterium]|nr:MAG: hypothetical protein CR983_01450 [Candidatus Saccharibacteria bacterium]
MKEITRVHLAKTAYDIELDAKTSLEKYLSAIQKTMKVEDDTMREIETRVTELLAERKVKSGGVITKSDVEAIRQQMGEPKDFSDSHVDAAEDTNDTMPESKKPKKRLMRDSDDAIIGGVCSGLAAYFGIDPIWVRLLAVASLLASMGSALLVYVILWIIMPAAKTSTDKLIMRGQEVTLESLKKFFDSNTAARSNQALAKAGRIVVGVILVMISIGAFIGTTVGGVLGIASVDWMEGFEAQRWASGLLAFLIAGGVALTVLSALLAQMVFSWKIKKPVGIASIVMLIVGLLSIPAIAVFGIQAKHEFSADKDRLTKTVKIDLPKDLDGVKNIETTGCKSAKSSLDILPSRSDTFRAELKYIAFKNAKQPQVSAFRQGESLIISIKNQTDQKDYPFFIDSRYCGGEDIWVDLYQPFESSVDYYGPRLAPYDDMDYDKNDE